MLFGIDLGGTKTEVVVLDPKDGHERFRNRVPTVKGSYADTLSTIRALVAQAELACACRAQAVGVAIPGTISKKSGRIKNANSSWLNGQDLLNDLQRTLRCPVLLENDANCFALSEAMDGAGQGKAVVWGLILGTGSGTGIIQEGKVLEGLNSLSGEWGHNPLPWMDAYEQELSRIQPCFCGRQGCIETFVSGTGFEAEYQRQSGRQLNGQQIAQRLAAGEVAALRTFDLYLDRLARSIACCVNFLDPDVIVLGGGMSNFDGLYQALPARILNYVFGGEFDTPLRKAVHGDSSGVRGAAFLTNAA